MTDEKLIAYVQAFRDGILEGRPSDRACYMVCAPLEGLLKFEGVKCRLAEGVVGDINHVWLVLRDGRVLDPTADQFNTTRVTLPPVYLGPPLPMLHKEQERA